MVKIPIQYRVLILQTVGFNTIYMRDIDRVEHNRVLKLEQLECFYFGSSLSLTREYMSASPLLF